MTLHSQAQAFIDLITENPRPPWQELGVEKSREVFQAFQPFFGESPALKRVEDHTVSETLKLRLYSNQTDAAPVIMFFHGGGWVLGNLETHDAMCRRIAMKSNCTVVAVDYGLSPENAFPGPISDCYRATEYVINNAEELNVDPTAVAVAGDSAGGHLAASVAIQARENAGPKIDLQVLIYPVLEPDFETESYREFESGYGLTRDNMRWFWEQFLGGRQITSESFAVPDGASPGQAKDLSGLPSAIIVTAQYDVLRDEGNAYAQRLEQAGVQVQHFEQPGMLHGFMHFAALFDDGAQVTDRIARQIGNRFGRK